MFLVVSQLASHTHLRAMNAADFVCLRLFSCREQYSSQFLYISCIACQIQTLCWMEHLFQAPARCYGQTRIHFDLVRFQSVLGRPLSSICTGPCQNVDRRMSFSQALHSPIHSNRTYQYSWRKLCPSPLSRAISLNSVQLSRERLWSSTQNVYFISKQPLAQGYFVFSFRHIRRWVEPKFPVAQTSLK